jgi:hypothetical protein
VVSALIVAMALQSSATGLPGRFDCAVERQVVIMENGYDPARQDVDFGEDQRRWNFRLRVTQGGDNEATIEWPGDPIQLAGSHLMLDIETGQAAFMVARRGPCRFSGPACLALVELSARTDGNLAFSILPAGSLRRESGNMEIFHVVLLGTCRRQSGA